MAQDGDAKVAADLAVDVARLRRAQQVAQVGSWELDLTTNTMWGSDEAFRIYGLAKTPDNQLPFALVREVPLPEHRPVLDQLLRDLAKVGKPYDTQFRICRPVDGVVRQVRSRAEVSRNAEGKPVLLTGTIQDVTELVEATMAVENALRANEERARLILEQAADAILLGDREGNIIDANETACALTGYTRDELVALDVRILFTPDSLAAKPLRFDLVDGGMNVINERILQRKDGGHVPIEMRSKRLSDNTLQSIIRDISERRRLEEQLQLRQRMDSLGTLAGGIAHDFNNILTAILGYADILRLSRPELAVEQRENVEQVLAAARRAGDLVRSLQSLSRPGPAQVATFDLHQVAAEIVHVLEETTDRLIVKELRFPPNLHLVKGDASAVYHALMNLGINAVQAVEDKGQGHDGRVIFDAEPYHAVTDGRRSLADGAYVHLTVRDTGAGMTEEVRQRVFEPLFTTKAKGERKGQGLGLAMVYNIVVRQHGGYVEVESSPGAGSTFHLYLPAGVAEPTVREVQAAPPRGGDESILVVEDEDQLLALTCTTLEGLGYRVLAARDGREALRVFQDHSDGIDLVVLDRTLPMLPGERVLREMQAVRADVKVLVSSGDASLDLASFPGACGLLSKPYELHRLCELIRQVLDGTTVSP